VTFACFGIAANGQSPPPVEVIHVGSALVDGNSLKPYKVRLKETIVNIQNIAIERGLWTDELRRITVNGKDAWQRHIEVVTPEGAFRETVDLVVDAATFAPLKTLERNPSGSLTFAFAGRAIEGQRTASGGSVRDIRARPLVDFFDYYGGMMELFLATLPFKAGRMTFPTTMATTDPAADATAIDWPIAEMKGEEQITVGGTTYRAWRAEINTPYGFYRVWVRKEPPFFVRTILLIPPGGRIVYDLLPE